jgi:hypothetical protein
LAMIKPFANKVETLTGLATVGIEGGRDPARDRREGRTGCRH